MNPWFKFYGSEFLNDPKIDSLSPQERCCWITLLCLAATSSEPGFVEFLTIEVLLKKSGIVYDPYHPEEWDRCLGILKKLEKMKMIETNDSGVIEVINWSKRQELSLTNAERQAKYRENKKSNEKVTCPVTKVTLEQNREDKNIDNISTKLSHPSSNEVQRKEIPYTKEFLEFWEVCPMKKGKPTAFQAYRKIDASLYPIIKEAMKKQAASGIWTEDKWTPWPQTWLNQMRWEDQSLVTADPLETEARALVKQFPPDNGTTAEFRFSAKYGSKALLKYKHIFGL